MSAMAVAELGFELEVGPHSDSDLALVEFDFSEAISHPYALEVVAAASPDATVDEAQLLHKDAHLLLHLGDGSARHIHGMVARVSRWNEGGVAQGDRLHFTVVPRLWTLQHTLRSRIFQDMTAVEIVEKLLKAANVKHRLELTGTYRTREYCVQYRESDLTFVSRLLEEEGIFYFFEHSEQSHEMVLGDSPSANLPLLGGEEVVYREKHELEEEVDCLHTFSSRVEIQPGAVVLRDFNFKTPAVDLSADDTAGDAEAALEIYDYPGRYDAQGDGTTLAKIRLEEYRAQVKQMTGGGSCRRFCPGYRFALQEHPTDALNQPYLVLSVRHSGKRENLLFSGGDAAHRGGTYGSEVVCMPASIPYRPRRVTPHPVIMGAQTAMVVGPSGEEIHTDEHGRIKVQFHWDREGQRNEHSSCWIRVSQAWAGPGWGALYLPRIGHEVVVDFVEGDPDRPLVVGSVYNGANVPPLGLPGEKTRSTLRSASTPGGDGSNELRFEDSAGAEEVYLHAQKDWNILVENDKTQEVRGNETLLVKKDRSRTIEGNQALEVKKNDDSAVRGNQSLQVTGNRTTTVNGNHTETVVGNQAITVASAQTVQVAMAATETIGLAKTITVGAAYTIAVGGAMSMAVGGGTSSQVSGAKSETVDGTRVETTTGARSLLVEGDLTEEVKKSRTLKVEKDLLIGVNGKTNQTVKDAYTLSAKEIVLAAKDELNIKVGSAEIQMKKSGDVIIKGAKVQVTASGDLLLQGSKIAEN